MREDIPEIRGQGSEVNTNDFGYNARSELTDADMPSGAYDYNYDLIGNRIQMTEDGSQTTDYAANSLNQYTNITGGTAASLSYDDDGNLTNDSVNAYTWNGENRLIKVEPLIPTNGALRVEFAYDHQGRRIQKEVYAWDSQVSSFEFQVSHVFVYDDWNLISEVRSQGSEVSTNLFTWGIDISGTLQGAGGVGGLLSVTTLTNSTASTVLTTYDANGNIAEYVTTNGTLAAHFEYDPYGKITAEAISTNLTGLTSSTFSHRFSTKYFDSETGLSYYGYRYYSPELGRWLNRDPINENIFKSLTALANLRGRHTESFLKVMKLEHSLYGSNYNNHLCYIDKDGRSVLGVVGAFLGGMFAGQVVCVEGETDNRVNDEKCKRQCQHKCNSTYKYHNGTVTWNINYVCQGFVVGVWVSTGMSISTACDAKPCYGDYPKETNLENQRPIPIF